MKRSWINILWSLWLFLCLALAVFGLQHHRAEREALLQNRRASVLDGLQELRASIQSLEQLGDLLLQTSKSKVHGTSNFAELEKMGRPYFSLYVFGPDSELLFPSSGAPSWLAERARGVSREEIMRPVPPGFSATRWTEEQPADYLLFAAPTEDGRLVVWSLDWQYFSQTWLRRKVKSFGLGDQLSYELLDLAESLEFEESVPWTWLVPTFLVDEVSLFSPLQLKLDNSKALRELYWQDLYLGLSALFLLLAFALALRMSTKALEKEARLAEEKTKFVSLVSHELRTPVSCIEMYLEILRENLVDDPNKIAEYHQILQRESHRLKSLVENLLRLGLAEAAGRSLEMKSVSIPALLGRVIETENREAREVKFCETEALTVQGDEDALYGIFANLLGNAIKYSPKDSTVEVTLEEKEGAKTVSFLDRGQGLLPGDYEILFKAYERRHQEHPGLGLGLTLARKLAQSQNCKVYGKPRPGGGSIFSVQWAKDDER